MKLHTLKKIIPMIAVIFSFVFLAPSISAQGLPTSGGNTNQANSANSQVNPTTTNNAFNNGIDLTATDLYNILIGLACYLEDIGLSLAILAIAYSGLLYITSQGNIAQITKAKTALTYSIIGLAVIIGVYVIIGTVANGVGAQPVSFFTCQRSSP